MPTPDSLLCFNAKFKGFTISKDMGWGTNVTMYSEHNTHALVDNDEMQKIIIITSLITSRLNHKTLCSENAYMY